MYMMFYNDKSTTTMVNSTPETKAAVESYLDNASLEWEWTYLVAKWDTIVVDYIGRLEDGTVFDTSVESVAKTLISYNSARDYTQWLEFEVGAWRMIAWFDSGVEWMKLWQTITITIPAVEAYWEKDSNLEASLPMDSVKDADNYKVGDTIDTPFGYEGIVVDITADAIVVDMNHPLAWKDLIFDITLKEIK